ncbi:branched-chain amino acid transaminase [Sulfobacillus harzensis]|uniref:Branched-chain-amino-acid aminotransferase n=1 Tax=Sulfobacillus harzensis TaxID=2729629 RepID=A0A7Y0L0L3_9FIRM|nr:branched-chain amino acid transaminase [Sulfobacillus harzensis]NMP21111.1 branched-chain amino acid transaminase [Sulfobacillus harzensis]
MSETMAFFNNRLMPLKDANVNIATHAFNYGTGVFEGLRAYWNAEQEDLFIVQAAPHFARLLRSARLLHIDVPYTVEELVSRTVELLRANQFRQDVYIRPLAYKADAAIKVGLSGIQSAFAMFALPMGDYVPMQGIKAQVSSWRRIADNMIPSRAKVTGAYVNAALSSDQAKSDGYDEAILLGDDGQVSEASSANLFMVRQGTLITTPVTADILEGITRQVVFDLAKHQGIPTEIRPVDRTELYQADELFLCGTGVQLAGIVEVDRRPIADGKPGPITSALQTRYFRLVRGQDDEFRRYVTPVYGSN